MTRKAILFLIFVTLFSPRFFVFAELEISEVMYDLKSGSDNGREWIEVFNNSNSLLDMTSFRLFEGDVSHKLKLAQGQNNLTPYGYAVIVSDTTKFKNDWPSFSGTILDSTFSLNNTGENLAIEEGELILDQFVYSSTMGGAGDGKSLQKINGGWVASVPSPGVENKITFISIPIQKTTTTSNSSSIKISEQRPVNKVEILQPPVDVSPNVSFGNKMGKQNNLYVFGIGLIFVVGLGGGTVFAIRKRKIDKREVDDFEILDE